MPPEKEVDNEDPGQFEAAEGSQFEGGDVSENEDLSELDRGDEVEPVKAVESKEPDEVKEEVEPDLEKEDGAEKTAEADEDVKSEGESETGEVAEPVVGKAKPRSKHVPRERFDQVNDRMRTAEEALRKLEQGAPESEAAKLVMEAAAFDFDGQEEAYIAAVLDGDTATAQKIRTNIRVAEREEFTKSLPAQGDTTAEATAQIRSDMAIDVIIQNAADAFPAVDPESDDYDQLVVDEVLETQNAFIVGSNMTPDKAMARAVRLILGDPDETTMAETVTEQNPVKEVEKKKTDIEKNVAASESTPTKIDTVGQRADTAGESAFDISSLSDEEFDAMPESKLRALRGDI